MSSHRFMPPVLAMLVILAATARAADVSILHAAPDEAAEREFPLVMKRQPSEDESDRLEALAHFAAARNALDRGENLAALRQFERAYRLAPKNSPALSPILSLAMKSKREMLAMEYLLDSTVREGTDADLLARLAKSLLEFGDDRRALRTFRQAIAVDAKTKPSALRVQIASQIATLCYKQDDAKGARDALQTVIDALDAPEKYALDDAQLARVKNAAVATLELLGYAELDCHNPDAASVAFERAEQLDSHPSILQFRLARVDEARDRAASALQHLQKYFDQGESAAGEEAPKLLRSLLKKEDRESEFASQLESLLHKDPDNLPLRVALAEQKIKGQDFSAAIALLEKSATATGARRSHVLSLMADAHLATQHYDEALAALGELQQQGPLRELWPTADEISASTSWLPGLLLAANKHQDTASGNALRRAAAEIAALAGNTRAAKSLYELEVAAAPKDWDELVLRWGRALMSAKQYDEAATVLARADDAKFGQRGELCRRYRMASLDMAGRLDEAVKLAEETLAPGEEPQPARMLLVGSMLHQAGRDGEAQKILAKLETDDRLASDDFAEIPRQARITLSLIASAASDMSSAEEYLQRVLDDSPNDAGAQNDLGYLWADQGKHLQRALVMVCHAVEEEPDNFAFRDSLGWIYFKLGDYSQAQKELQAAVRSGDADGEIWDHLGEVYFAQGDSAAAADAWLHAQTALDKRPNSSAARHIQEKLDRVKKMPPPDGEPTIQQ